MWVSTFFSYPLNCFGNFCAANLLIFGVVNVYKFLHVLFVIENEIFERPTMYCNSLLSQNNEKNA